MMIGLKDFTIGFGEKKLLDNLTMEFPDAKLIALIGKNGSGKSTLLKALCGLNDKYSGSIIIDGNNLKEILRKKLASTIAYVNTQRPRNANLKCKDIVALGRSPYTAWDGKLSNKDKQVVENAITMVGMQEYINSNFNTLSDGESQKIMIARAVAQDTKIIILDEPTSFLDLPTRYELVSILKELTLKGKTIIYSTHELDIAFKMSDYIALVDDHKIINLPVNEIKNYIKEQKHQFYKYIS